MIYRRVWFVCKVGNADLRSLRGGLCRHHDVDDELFLVLNLRQLCVEMVDCQARRAAEFSQGGAVFSGVGAWRVCGHDILGGGRDSYRAVDVYYD